MSSGSESASFPAVTIEQVIERLSEIVDWAKAEESRLGYFAALYRNVTRAVKARIDEGGFFDDDQRMGRLDVVFASRYLTAFEQLRSGEIPTRSWAYAFEVAVEWWPIVLQHLLLGMNAHINLDLGIAAARVSPGDELTSLHDDFNRINELLAGLVGEVQDSLAWIWPPLRWLNRRLGSVEKAIINFSMSKARDEAWSVAERLAPLTVEQQASVIEKLDGEVAEFANVIRHPGFFPATLGKIIRLGERGSVRRIIETLE
jgi:hypothetical protein